MRKWVLLIALCCLVVTLKAAEYSFSNRKLLNQVQEYRKQHEHQIIGEFFELLAIPNVSADQENIRRNAKFIKKLMEKRGLEAQVIETPGNPVVYGELKVPAAAHTLLFYMHYDGQPVDPSQWTDSKPFKPVFRPGKMRAGTSAPKPFPLPAANEPFNEEWCLYGRSTSDDKAPIICLLTTIDAINKAGYTFRNNLKFIFEGEEEVGSPNLGTFLKQNKELLKADVLFMCDGPAYFSGDPTIFFGVRGITSLEM